MAAIVLCMFANDPIDNFKINVLRGSILDGSSHSYEPGTIHSATLPDSQSNNFDDPNYRHSCEDI